jgi:predicted nucleotidyltransferase
MSLHNGHMSQLTDLAEEFGVDERTLRRAAAQGTLRAERLSPRKLLLAPGEARYLRRHWELLAGLRSALRTEPNVAFATLFGSVARGDDGADSDVDLLVELREHSTDRLLDLQDRLEGASGREIHLVDMETASRNDLLLSMAVEDGRVLVDREGRWGSLRSELDALRRRADRALERDRRHALSAVDSFLS